MTFEELVAEGAAVPVEGWDFSTLRELTDFMMGPQPVSDARSTERAVAGLEAAGLTVVDLRSESLRVEFFDVGAVVHFLRKVLWTVPGFTVSAYRDRLWAMHEHIEREGSFVASSERYLVEARKEGQLGV
ncbi:MULTISPECIES: hypothetical protein [Saccharothrix]|uniref:hypothetical protein n=1 Tax=Saccharothrix TaxID=2071 RepID=UPI0009397A06|nr:hypothetical protein [Saccharothrix sp. CB00851]OKI22310.1 hypothetical protein A6A25_36150 [Saccharothrix sp. CB00851]